MENQYNYYNTGENDSNNIFDEQPKSSYGQNSSDEKPPKRRKKLPKVVAIAGSAILFGVVASMTFFAASRIADKLFGDSGGQNVIEEQEGIPDSSNIKLKQSSSIVSSDVSEIVQKNMPSMVSITNMSVQEVQSFFGGIQQRESTSGGTGIIVGKNDTELLIVTNNHVIEGAQTLTVSFVDDKSVEGSLKGTDPSKDLAVVAVPLDSIEDSTMEAIQTITIGDSTSLQVGEPVIAIGNALGYGQSVTKGIVSALNRDLEMEGFDSKLIQTDAAINPGNSGGALLNANGELIGINTVKVNANAVEGMGYAIPISDANEVIQALMNRTTRTKVPEGEQGYLGIQGVDVTSDSSQMYNMPTGVYIAEVIKKGGADKAGISKGSIITKFDGITIDSMATLQEQLKYFRVGEEVEVVIQVPSSNGEYEEETVTVTLGQRS
ncbi:MAG: trypsin-like serine protease [Dorea sp.]|nr:trypsin-like serine protease [Dorea sp.]